MKYKLGLGVTFGTVLLTSLVAHVPASWVWQQVPPVRGLNISGLSGTPWQGMATQVQWQGKSYGRLQWDMAPLSLLSGKAVFNVRFGQGSDMNINGRGIVGYSTSGPFAENLLVSMPAQQVMTFARVSLPVTVAGNLELTLRDYQYQAPYCSVLKGSLAWTAGNVSSPMGGVNPGPVIADLNCEQGKIAAEAAQSSADVSSEWQAVLATDQRYTLNGWFKPGAEFPAQLGKQLKWLGNPDPKGRYKISYNGRL